MDKDDKGLDCIDNLFHVRALFIEHSASALALQLLDTELACEGSTTSYAPIH